MLLVDLSVNNDGTRHILIHLRKMCLFVQDRKSVV